MSKAYRVALSTGIDSTRGHVQCDRSGGHFIVPADEWIDARHKADLWDKYGESINFIDVAKRDLRELQRMINDFLVELEVDDE